MIATSTIRPPSPTTPCPLCGGDDLHPIAGHHPRPYWRCGTCWFIHMDESAHLNAAQEQAFYQTHHNEPDDPGYLSFLNKLANPTIETLKEHTEQTDRMVTCLDFGCGPGPSMQHLFARAGYDMALYDKFYETDESVWQQSYDAITASEVVEHLSTPRQTLDHLWAHLKPEGILAIMTGRWLDEARFKTWRYTHDPTHIGFFHEKTCHWLAGHLGAELRIISPTVFLLIKPD